MSVWTAIGWIGNACYFSRFLVQWLLSERARRSVTPLVFWWLSLGGCLLLGSYAARRGELVLLPGFFVNGAIYVRNLFLARGAEGSSRLGPIPAALLGLAVAAALFLSGAVRPRPGIDDSIAWLAIGIGGQTVWSFRFLVQWWCSERAGRSHFPTAFWWISLAGSALNLSYATHLGDPIFIASYLPTPIYPIRNLMLVHASARRAREHSCKGRAG